MTSGPCAARTAAQDARTVEDGLATSVEPNMVARTLSTSESAHVGSTGSTTVGHNRTLEPSHGVVEVLGEPPLPRAPLET